MRKALWGMLIALAVSSFGAYGEQLADGAYYKLENGKVRLTFQRRGDGLALVSIQRLPDGSLVSLDPYSAEWRINLKTRDHPAAELSLALSTLREVKPVGMDGEMAAGGDWFEAHWSEQEDREARESPWTKGEVHLKEVSGERESLTATWDGNGQIFDESCRFEVTERWRLQPQDVKAHTSIEVTVLPPEKEKQTPIYLSSVDYPIYRIQAIGERDHLAAPWIGGHLYHHPIKNKMHTYGNEPGAIWMPVYAYYDDGTGDCLYICNTDTTGTYKIIEMRTADGYLLYRDRQIPPDVFASREYKQPYENVLGVLKGDWITAAETYRDFLAKNASWYKGPVAAATNPMPQRVKDCMVVSTHQWGPDPETVKTPDWTPERIAEYLKSPGVRDPRKATWDVIGEDEKLVSDRFGAPVFGIWYARHYEGSILGESPLCSPIGRKCCYYSDDHTQEAEKLTRAVAIAQANPLGMVAPYMNGKCGYLFVLNPLDKGPYTSRNYGVLASAIISENGSFTVKGKDCLTHLCPAAPWWSEHLPQAVLDHYMQWGIRGVYLDYLKAFHTCYSENHGHKPGGGDFVIQGKVQQMRRMREVLAAQGMNDFAIGMEGANGPYTAEANFGNRHVFTNWGNIAESEAIPYAEWVFDNTKYHRISSDGARADGKTCGTWAWNVAMEAFPFKHIVSVGNGLVNYREAFGEPEGEPYYDFLSRMVKLLRSDGFMKYHSGSLARQLEGRITPEGDFHVPLSGPFGFGKSDEGLYFDRSSDGNYYYAKPYILSVLPRGMFKSPDGNLAFAICNPWVGPNPFSKEKVFVYEFTFDPARYTGFPSRYTLTKVAHDGKTTVIGKKKGKSLLKGKLGPGEIEYWTMEK